MKYLPDYTTTEEIEARWNLVQQTFAEASFNFNSLSARVLLDHRTLMSQVNVVSPTYSFITNVPDPTYAAIEEILKPTFTEVTIG